MMVGNLFIYIVLHSYWDGWDYERRKPERAPGNPPPSGIVATHGINETRALLASVECG